MGEERNDLIGKVIDYIFSMKKITLYLIIIFILGFILRLIAAINLSVSADDMHFVTHAINFFSSERLVTYDQSSGLWFAFTDIIYGFLGYTQIASRMAALIFGSLSILAIYLISREFFDEKISIVSAFLLAIAPFHIKLTISEQDVMAMFFVLVGMLLFIKALKNNKLGYFSLSGMFIGLSIYSKVYTLLFIPSLLIYFIYVKVLDKPHTLVREHFEHPKVQGLFNYNRKIKNKLISKDNSKKILIFLLAIFIFTIPALTHNYLLYKDKGIMDLQFTRVTGLGKNISAEYYSWDHQFNAKNDWKGLIFGNSKNSGSKIPTLLQALNYIKVGDPINFYLGIIGLLVFIVYNTRKKHNPEYIWFFISSILFALPFLASIILLPKHYVFLEILIIPFGAFGITKFNERFFKSSKKSMNAILILIFLISLVFLGLNGKGTNTHFYGKSHVAQIIEFKDKNIQEAELIIGDSRFYRGRIHWMFQGNPYLEGVQFLEFINQNDQIPGNTVMHKVYFVECAIDDCGWGNIAEQPEFNQSMELLTELFKQSGKLIYSVREPDREKNYPPFSENTIETARIYSATLPIKDSIITYANQPKEWFLYTIGYQPLEKQYDYYTAKGTIDKFLDTIAHWIVIIALILAFISPIYIIYLILKD
ncbi:MAG: glycosyltransferase family 39 protein [Nanoarchaeota archaeon]